MTLQSHRSKRKFKLENDKLSYINRLLSHDDSFDCHLKLVEDTHLECEDGVEIAHEIMRLLYSNHIYEYLTEDNTLYPVVISVTQSQYNGKIVRPICKASSDFLSVICDFLSCKERINIVRR